MSALATEQPSFFAAAPGPGRSPVLDVVRTHARNVPGVYRMYAASGAVLYVGRSRQLRTRLLSYFRASGADDKAVRLLRETARLDWDELPSELDAVVRECRLIRAHLPRFNREMARPASRFWAVYATRDAVPRLRVVRITALTRDVTGPVVGPFTQPRLVRDALRVLNDALGLRDCPDEGAFGYADDGDLFDAMTELAPQSATPRCHRFETRRCLGPCIAAAPRRAYQQALDTALAYLAGTSAEPADALRDAIAAASAELAYERAGWLRNRLATLAALDEQLARVRVRLDQSSGFLVIPGRPGEDRVVALHRGQWLGDALLRDADATAALEAQWAHTARARATPWRADQIEEVFTVSRWLATHEAVRQQIRPSVRDAVAAARGSDG